MASTTTVKVNRQWIDALAYQVSLLDGHLSPSSAVTEPVVLGNGAGVSGSSVRVEPRTVMIGLDVRPASYEARQTALDAIRQALGGLLEVETSDLPGRVMFAELTSVRAELYTGAQAMPEVWVECTLSAVDPVREDVEPQVYAISTTARTVVPLGNEMSAPVIEIAGACTDPSIVVRNGAGVVTQTMAFAVTLAANDALVVDALRGTIDRYVAGVLQTGASAGLAAYSSGPLPLLSPEDGAVTVALSAVSGTPAGSVTYRRRW